MRGLVNGVLQWLIGKSQCPRDKYLFLWEKRYCLLIQRRKGCRCAGVKIVDTFAGTAIAKWPVEELSDELKALTYCCLTNVSTQQLHQRPRLQ